MARKTFTVTMDKKYAEMLELYSERKNKNKKLVIETFIAAGVKYDIVRADWTEDMRRDFEIESETAEARSGCSALAISVNLEKKKDYRCVWFREDKPPQIRKLGNTPQMQKKACLACGRTGEIVAKIKARDTKINELETELGDRATQKLKVPKCNRGAVLNHDREDQLIMTHCFRHRGGPVSVASFCKVQARGLPCMFFAEIVVGVEGRA